MLQLIVPDAIESERREILKEQGSIYERDYLGSIEAFDGVKDVFRAITMLGGKVALATDCKGAAFRRYLSLLNADEFIAGTACGDDVEYGKPDPRLVGHALHKLGIPASRAVMIGDTPYDAEAGLDAGTRSAGVLTGGFSADTLLQAGCFAVAPDVQALLFSLQSGEAVAKDQATMGQLLNFPSKRMAG